MQRKNLWFLTLFSLILVLSIYYITMPNDLLKENSKIDQEVNTLNVDVKEVSSLDALRVSLLEKRQNEMDTLQKELSSNNGSVEEKNNIYEKLKYLNELQGIEEQHEKDIKEKFKLNSFVKIDNNNINIVCISLNHNHNLANNIMRLVQEKYKTKKYITIKFQQK